MISVIISRQGTDIKQIDLSGHAGFADEGEDIVCSAVSILVINTFNSIERFTDDDFRLDAAGDGGDMSMVFFEKLSDRSQLLLDSMILGLDEIQKQYGDNFISLEFKEV